MQQLSGRLANRGAGLLICRVFGGAANHGHNVPSPTDARPHFFRMSLRAVAFATSGLCPIAGAEIRRKIIRRRDYDAFGHPCLPSSRIVSELSGNDRSFRSSQQLSAMYAMPTHHALDSLRILPSATSRPLTHAHTAC